MKAYKFEKNGNAYTACGKKKVYSIFIHGSADMVCISYEYYDDADDMWKAGDMRMDRIEMVPENIRTGTKPVRVSCEQMSAYICICTRNHNLGYKTAIEYFKKYFNMIPALEGVNYTYDTKEGKGYVID